MAISLVAEDGTGLSTANVYDLAAACETWLIDRGYTLYAAGTAPEKDRWLLEATELMERESSSRVVGEPVGGDDQAMLWPRSGSVDRRHRTHDSDERPVPYREGIFLLAESIAAAGSTRLVLVDAGVKSEKDSEGSVVYRDREQTTRDRYPAAFDRASESYPAGIRAARA